MTPGSNILLDAMTVLGSTTVKYFAFASVAQNSAGMDVTTYSTGVDVPGGSVQAVPRSVYKMNGLDFAKRYVEWIVPANVLDWARDMSGDVIEVLGRRFQLPGNEAWYSIDGWDAVVCIDIGPATGNTTNA